jgi:hypothetical protein
MTRGPLEHEIRQSLSLLLIAAATMAVYLGLGLLAVHVLG